MTEPSFLAVTWNVLFSTGPKTNQPTLDRLKKRGVTIILLQEANKPEDAAWLRENGFAAVRQTGRIIAWDPGVWEAATKPGVIHWAPVRDKWSGVSHDSPVVRLRHKKSGRLVEISSYHFRSRVDRGRPNPAEPMRVAVTKECMDTMRARVKATPASVAILYGGDDNIDESRGRPLSVWDFMRRGIQQVVAPSGTHGNRRIDDFRVRGLAVGPGEVWGTPSDHDLHIRNFTFKPLSTQVPAKPPAAQPDQMPGDPNFVQQGRAKILEGVLLLDKARLNGKRRPGVVAMAAAVRAALKAGPPA